MSPDRAGEGLTEGVRRAGYRHVARVSPDRDGATLAEALALFGGDAGALAPLFAARGEAAIPPSMEYLTKQTEPARCAG